MKKAELKMHNIVKQFPQDNVVLEVLRGVSAHFIQGSTYALTGASGVGKSTLLYLLAGLDIPNNGSVTFNDYDIACFSDDEQSHFLNKNIGLVFQLPYLIDELSVLENVMLKGLITGIDIDQAHHRAQALLTQVGLSQKAESKPSTLSGGQQQRVAVIRALFNEPAFLLADEPTGNLDKATGASLIGFLLDCQAQWHMGIIMSSHDPSVAMRMQSILTLHNGLLVGHEKTC